MSCSLSSLPLSEFCHSLPGSPFLVSSMKGTKRLMPFLNIWFPCVMAKTISVNFMRWNNMHVYLLCSVEFNYWFYQFPTHKTLIPCPVMYWVVLDDTALSQWNRCRRLWDQFLVRWNQRRTQSVPYPALGIMGKYWLAQCQHIASVGVSGHDSRSALKGRRWCVLLQVDIRPVLILDIARI